MATGIGHALALVTTLFLGVGIGWLGCYYGEGRKAARELAAHRPDVFVRGAKVAANPE